MHTGNQMGKTPERNPQTERHHTRKILRLLSGSLGLAASAVAALGAILLLSPVELERYGLA